MVFAECFDPFLITLTLLSLDVVLKELVVELSESEECFLLPVKDEMSNGRQDFPFDFSVLGPDKWLSLPFLFPNSGESIFSMENLRDLSALGDCN